MMLNFWFNTNRKVAYDWADENAPLAWWKLVFATREQQLAEGLDIDNTKT